MADDFQHVKDAMFIEELERVKRAAELRYQMAGGARHPMIQSDAGRQQYEKAQRLRGAKTFQDQLAAWIGGRDGRSR